MGIQASNSSSYIDLIEKIVAAIERDRPLPSISENQTKLLTPMFWIMVGVGGIGSIGILGWAIAKAFLD